MLGVDFLFYFSFSFLCHLFILLFLSSLTFYFISLEFIIIIILFGYLLYFLFFSYFNFLLVLVASTSSQDFFYKLFSFISVQEGSAFIWYFFFIFGCWVLGFFNTYFVRISSGLFHFLLYLRFFFFCFLFFFSNSFLLVDFFIVDGYSLNLILQNFLVSIHPFLLYFAYIFTIFIFSFLLYFFFLFFFSRSFVLFYSFYFIIYFFLSCGICLGSFWAYNEFGWGGWWFWDPIETISLFLWLLILVLYHFVRDLRNFLLFLSVLYLQSFCILSLLFSIFFLRSGFLSSIHNFIVDSFSSIFLLFGLCFFLLFLFFFFFFCYKNAFLEGAFHPILFFVFFTGKSCFFKFRSFFLGVVCLCFLLYFFILFWMTFLSFFYKMYFGLFILDADFYNLITLYFVFFVLFYYYFSCFNFFYSGSFFDFFLFWSLSGLLFYFGFFIVWNCALLLLAFFRILFLRAKGTWHNVLHFLFFFFVILVVFSSYFSFFFTLLLTPGFLWEIYSVYFLLEPCLYFESLLCSDMYSNMFFLLIFDDKLHVLSEICFEQYYDFLSNVQSNKFEVLNSIFFDLHVYIDAVSYSESFVLRLYLKLFWGLGWFVFVFFIFVFSFRFGRFSYNFI